MAFYDLDSIRTKERIRQQELDLPKTEILADRQIIGLWYSRQMCAAIYADFVWTKPAGVELFRTKTVGRKIQSWKSFYHDYPRFLKIKSVKEFTRLRADEVLEFCRGETESDIMIPVSNYLKTNLEKLPNIIHTDVFNFDNEILDLTDDVEELIESEKIRLLKSSNYNHSNEFHKNSLLLMVKNLYHVLTADSLLVYEKEVINFNRQSR